MANRGNAARLERNENGLRLFFEGVRYVLQEISNDVEGNVEIMITRIEDAIPTLILLKESMEGRAHGDEDFRIVNLLNTVLSEVRNVHQLLIQEKDDTLAVRNEVHFRCPHNPQEGAGRPSIAVSREQIEFLRDMHFSWIGIAALLGISESTLRRRREMFGIGNFPLGAPNISGNPE